MTTVTISFDDTDPNVVGALGADVLISVAEDKGYTTDVHNPDYVPAVGEEQIPDPDWVPGEGQTEDDRPMIANPDYVPAQGDPTIPNPDTPGEYIAKKTIKEAIVPYLFAQKEQRARRDVEAQIAVAKQAVEVSAIVNVQ